MLREFFKRIVVEAIRELISPQLQELREEIHREVARLQEQITQLREEMRREIAQLREEMHREITRLERELARLREEMMAEIRDIRNEIREINRRLDTLYDMVLHQQERFASAEEMRRLREDVEMLKRKVGIEGGA